MPGKRVHGNVGVARQAAVGQAAAGQAVVVWSKIQKKTQECHTSGCGLSYTAKKLNVF